MPRKDKIALDRPIGLPIPAKHPELRRGPLPAPEEAIADTALGLKSRRHGRLDPEKARRPRFNAQNGDPRTGLTLRLHRKPWQQLKALAAEEAKSSHDLLLEAVTLLFAKRGKYVFSEDEMLYGDEAPDPIAMAYATKE